MLRDFNCGIDMILIVDKNVSSHILNHINSTNKTACPIGIVVCEKDEDSIEMVNAFDDENGTLLQKKKIAVFTSDKGTTLKSLIEYSENPKNFSSYEIAVVVCSDNTNLESAKIANIPTVLVNADTPITEILKSYEVEVICLDNFSNDLCFRYMEGKILNIHPSLLPAFKCENTHQEVLTLGAKITGCTVHVRETEDSKEKIIDQAAVVVDVSDTVQTLEDKVCYLQNAMYPIAVELFISEKRSAASQSHVVSGVSCSLSSCKLLSLNKDIKAIVQSTKRPGFTEFTEPSCGIFDLKVSGYQNPYLISGTDGVGTKLKIAQVSNKHDTIGIDLVAMCVNDILTHGAEPLFFLTAFDCGKINPNTVRDVFSGVAEGCKQANCALVGTEINEIPDIYLNPKESFCDFEKYDVVGYAEGALQKEHLLPRLSDIKAGDVLIGIPSSGVHSNGYSLVRKLVQLKNYRYQDPFPLDKSKTLQEVLLAPTKIYVKSVLPLIQKGYVKAAAHITGGGLTQNIPRVLPSDLKVVLDGSKWNMPPIMKWIAAEGQLSEEEMLQTFNCGIGMVLIVDKNHEIEVLKILEQVEEPAITIGCVSNLCAKDDIVVVKNFKLQSSSDMKKKKKVGVLISGSGTNLQALIDYTQNPNNCSSAEIVLVLSNVPNVEGLNRAKRAGIPTKVLSHKEYKKRVDFDMAVHAILKEAGVEIVCLAGFMRILSKEFVHLWQGNLLNVHPAILPAFKGVHAHRQALEAGAKITGCTVHFVEAEVDAGAIIQQAAAKIDPDDTEESLQEKVKVLEHQIFPTALELLASEKISRSADGKLQWHF
ncbi:trifunctional purine biosynthetic protein adenosine-3 [Caerostris extrusa]|uniref:Trifunctional purine biosynthetic protein adenosine-3 n=1 Tax=Caerostris extrusa TaxID=172846 RepID=A0AAV4TQQ0_CAEEX|nr:trifunctional purine biosynthetic protein adenosine-3 [Caerostris extrusa]